MNFLRQIWYGLENLVHYFPLIWNDRDWDNEYLYEFIRYKLVRMEKFYRNDAIFVGMEDVADDIQKCIYGLNRLINDEYLSNIYRNHDKRWGKNE